MNTKLERAIRYWEWATDPWKQPFWFAAVHMAALVAVVLTVFCSVVLGTIWGLVNGYYTPVLVFWGFWAWVFQRHAKARWQRHEERLRKKAEDEAAYVARAAERDARWQEDRRKRDQAEAERMAAAIVKERGTEG